MKEENGMTATPVEPIVICVDAWYVLPRETVSTAAIYFSVALVAPSRSASQAWKRFLAVFGETQKHWKRKDHIAKKISVTWTCSK